MNIDIKKELFFGWGSGGCGSFDGWCPALSHGKGTEFTFRLSSPPYSASPSTSPTACQLSYFSWPGGSGAGATSIYTKTLTDIASELATLKSILFEKCLHPLVTVIKLVSIHEWGQQEYQFSSWNQQDE